ncbi:MAG: 30S ribosomal protein S12 methylthiotransferase RimO [Firmicutes bacterium]|nr:30S ribosomal protein S12 methylthiotransferase RimO [Bacillota bacterium]
MTKVAVLTLGCSKNLVDAEYMLGMLKNGGFSLTAEESEADVIIVNTCCFINDAKQESIDAILEAAKQKQEGKCKNLIVTGCLAQRYKEEITEQIPEVDKVVGVGHINDILLAANGGGKKVYCENPYSHPVSERLRQAPEYSAYLKIADGCDNNCTYCIIPYIRGGFLSRPIDRLVSEAKQFAAEGVTELILIAQDTASYGVDLYSEPQLELLLEKLCEIDGIRWIRLLYCYPERITDTLIDLIAKKDKICKYLDIPIQHCNDEILRKMGRKTTKAQIENIISKVRAKIPNITLRTTLITGFPGETNEQCNQMASFIKRMKFERLGIFPYSQEEGTPAAKLKGQISEKTKAARLEKLMLIQQQVAAEVSKSKIGSTITVLCTGYDPCVKLYYGRSEADSPEIDGMVFYASSQETAPGQFVKVKITDAEEYDLFGEALL